MADNAVSQQDLDNAVASEASRASMAAAEAHTTASSTSAHLRDQPHHRPRRQPPVDVGSYVGSPEPTVLTVVSALDPVRFDFTISEAEYLAYARDSREAGKRSGSGPELELVLADGSVHSQKGRVTVVGRGSMPRPAPCRSRPPFPIPAGSFGPGSSRAGSP